MARITSTRTIEALVKQGLHSAGNGLYLKISKHGGKTWVLRYQCNGRRHDAGLGTYPLIGLADARQAALDGQRCLAQGLDPIQQRRLQQQASKPVPTFSDIAAQVLADVERLSLNQKSLYRAQLLLGPIYCSSLLNQPVTAITATDIAKLLNPVASTKPETARKLHSCLAKVFEAARVTLRGSHGITLEHQPTNLRDLKALGYERRVINQPYPALDWREAPQFMAALRARTGVAYRALEFTILTGVRESAVAGAEWKEIDLQAGVWTVPLERLKDRRHRKQAFRVPLSDSALEILQAVSGLDQKWIFPGLKAGSHIVPQSMLQILKLNLNRHADGSPIWVDPHSRLPVVVHGFRATLKTYADDHGVRYEVSEYTLGHAVGGDVERRYRRTDLLEDRRRFLQAWADHCDRSLGANIVALHG